MFHKTTYLPIDINKPNQSFRLRAKEYKIDVLGGWKVSVGGFSISIKNLETQEIIRARGVTFPAQSYNFNRKTKRILKINVPSNGIYEVIFHNPEYLKVKRSNMPLISFFEDYIPTLLLCVYFH